VRFYLTSPFRSAPAANGRPWLAEQRRIVGILDKTFASIAAAQANTEKKLAALDALKKSLLPQAFSGQL
jgi:type I restriction enzyme, S subunit